MWPASPAALIAIQHELSTASPPPWRRGSGQPEIGGCIVCFPRGQAGPGSGGDRAWAAAAVLRGGRLIAEATVAGEARAPYIPGLLALREGPMLDAAVSALASPPDVLLVDATGRDHPRRAGLAVQLGAVLGLATVGVTHRPLLAAGAWPEDRDGASAPLLLGSEPVGAWLRTHRATRPLAVHPGWRTNIDTAVEIVLAAVSGHRTPEPLRRARTHARTARARDEAAHG
ncbi:MAG: endonuclease V [Solirubrobacterales bacterium]|nr:endonuclease V [Solirubrobacterales bacterium]MBV9717403.1 endonuclease V [Solirubrobacterales bacterium]